MEKKTVHDPKNYAKNAEPFSSVEEANEGIAKFIQELGELRNKYGIPELVYVISVNANHKGKVVAVGTHGSFGASASRLPMLAFAYGQIKKEEDEILAKLLSGENESVKKTS